ncbi:MAG: putative baseplate assembly protein [Cyanobacteria bacterium P01_H01_bin.162]
MTDCEELTEGMEFDFLPNLPKSDLDDRKFEDLVEECLQRIPRYCPEWTNFNPSDPGMTLVELFSWLTDQMLTRFNQVPRRQYIAFLELLGMRLQPPTPAQVEITFYLSSALPQQYIIPTGIEIATERTATEEAVVFTTDAPLAIGCPRIRHLLTAPQADGQPQALRDRLVNRWSQTGNGDWSGAELPLFNEQPEPGNCFYLVFDEAEPLDGNAIALTAKGQQATPTGINPNLPPRRWEAWDGEQWQPILDREADDETQGFSFNELARRGGNPLQGADVLLHLPVEWPAVQFTTYRGRWLRCVCLPASGERSGYEAAPRITGLACRAVGGTVRASQCLKVERELLGISNGEPGQVFTLAATPVLPRLEGEHIVTVDAIGAPQRWQEVNDFAESSAQDLHYTLDSGQGIIQFGPQVRESQALRSLTYDRRSATLPTNGDGATLATTLEQQYGAVPPRGSRIYMAAYRTGGSLRGNVQASTVQILKAAVPYVTHVTNRHAAHNGSDGETLEQAVIRVPKLLRSRDRAVTPEDFETLTLQAGQGSVARARCLPATAAGAGTVRVLVIPQVDLTSIQQGLGLAPAALALNDQLEHRILHYLDERRLLGVQVVCDEPDYTGLSVQAELYLEAAYDHPEGREDILRRLRVALYSLFNPISGGPDGSGWPFGRPVYVADVIALFQSFPQIRQIGAVQLFEMRWQGDRWQRLPPSSIVDPGEEGTICSWSDRYCNSGHFISCA